MSDLSESLIAFVTQLPKDITRFMETMQWTKQFGVMNSNMNVLDLSQLSKKLDTMDINEISPSSDPLTVILALPKHNIIQLLKMCGENYNESF